MTSRLGVPEYTDDKRLPVQVDPDLEVAVKQPSGATNDDIYRMLKVIAMHLSVLSDLGNINDEDL